MWQRFLDWLLDSNNQIILTIVAAVTIYAIARVLRRALLVRAVDLEKRHSVRRTVSWISVLFFFAVAALIWAKQIGSLGVFLGIIGAGLALSLQEALLCVAGWMLIITKRPFVVGDRVEINKCIGDVIDISIFQITLLEIGNWVDADQSTGRILILPNSDVFRHGIYNYTKGFPFIWNEFSTVVTFESDWRAAKELMLQQAQEEAEKIEGQVSHQIKDMQSHYAIQYEHFGPIVYTSIAANGVQLALRYLSPVRKRRATTHRIAEGILDAFVGHPEIDLAYPTTRIFRNAEEGREHLRPGPREEG